jgi:hypothetical protein
VCAIGGTASAALAHVQFWIRSSLTFSLSVQRPMTGSSISAAILVRTFFSPLPWARICYMRALWHLSLFFFAVGASGGFFQIRPQKDFRPERGRNNVLSLGLLSDLPEVIPDPPDLGTSSEPRNAYEFMQRRRDPEGNPTLRRWNASIRMSNFATLDASPFAVCSMQPFLPPLECFCMNREPSSSVRSVLCSTISSERKHWAIWNLKASEA